MNPKKNIPHPEAERGRANALLLFMLAFIAASFTLMAATKGSGKKKDGTTSDRKCPKYGDPVQRTNEYGIVECKRPILARQVCADCTVDDNNNKEDCRCEANCVNSGGWDSGTYEKRTITETKDVKGDAKLGDLWKFVSVNADGTRKYEMKREGPLQCYYRD
jgi:hypothetical protein